jgi:hypothetical protein
MEISEIASLQSSPPKTIMPPNDITSVILQQRLHGQKIEQIAPGTVLNDGILDVFSHVVCLIGVLKTFGELYKELSILHRAIGWEIAHSLSFVARWYLDFGPALADSLFDIHHTAGKIGLQEQIPAFEQERIPVNRELPASCFAFSSSACAYTLPDIPLHTLGSDIESQHNFGKKCFLRAISDLFLSHGIRDVDQLHSGPKRRQMTGDVRLGEYQPWINRTLIRGMTIEAIVKACGGDDGILASKSMESILTSPAYLFDVGDSHTNDTVVASKILRNPSMTMAPLESWLNVFLVKSPDTLPKVKELGDILYAILCQRSPQSFPRLDPLQLIAQAKPRRIRSAPG